MAEVRHVRPENPDEPSIEGIFEFISEMFDLVDEQLADAVNVLISGDRELAEHVRQLDRQVDMLELETDNHCEKVLEGWAASGIDLRRVLAATRMAAELERIGDLCKSIVKHAIHFENRDHWRAETRIIEIADSVRNIVRVAREALSKSDRLAARRVLAMDRQVDRAYRELNATIVRHCKSHPEDAGTLIRINSVGKLLERVADNAKSVAKYVVYIIEGVDLRHIVWKQPASAG